MDRDGTVALLEAILADLPQLDGASCVGLHEVFDQLPGRGPSRDLLQRQRDTAAVEVCEGARHGRGARVAALIRPFRDLRKRRSRLQGKSWSGATFGKITGNGQIGYFGVKPDPGGAEKGA